jgi:hypothetical protein
MTCQATKGVCAPSTWWHDADVIHERAIGEWPPSRWTLRCRTCFLPYQHNKLRIAMQRVT